ncbi:methyltransferase domain-containing protein [Nonomuraea sp. NN258]|uniref:class I SAM-dependent methyltransferase n=1 Tax=Nonomuraea antri TaxID=2730852 RepID=UPI001569CEAA|nr:class I SAM-dependent methyltransferase [Nonomuraea antri]NRQ33345.1 methyltransferase domain-containing protein [Nonomuraea antri]
MEDPTTTTMSTYDRIAPVFAARSAEPGAEFTAMRRRFAETLAAGARLADLGCGPGRDLVWFREQGFRPVGVDRSAEMVKLAVAAGATAVRGDQRRPPLAQGAFDALWSSAALLHVPDAETGDTLRRWWELLRPGGALKLSTSVGDGGVWEDVPYESGLRRWFVHRSPEALLSLLGAAGFEIREHGVTDGHRTWFSVLAVKAAG